MITVQDNRFHLRGRIIYNSLYSLREICVII